MNQLTPEDYAKAINSIGQDLLERLQLTFKELDPTLRNNEVLFQGLSAFLVNVLYQQSPNDEEKRQQMLQHLTKIMQEHLTQ